MQRRKLPDGWDKRHPGVPRRRKGLATREASGAVLNAIAPNLPWIVGGSADLAPSTKTLTQGRRATSPPTNPTGRNIHFGVREHAHGRHRQRDGAHEAAPLRLGTFLIFTDYMRAADPPRAR